MRVERNISTADAPTEVIETPIGYSAPANAATSRTSDAAPVEPAVETVVVPVEHHVETVRVATETTLLPAAVTGGLFSVLLLVFGGVALARAGVSGPWDEPIVSVGGFTATAILGLFAAGSGFALLVASLTRSRSAILLFAIIAGIVAAVAAIEPTIGNGALAIERGFAVLVAIGAGIVVLSAVLVPTVHRTASHVERA